MSDNDTCNEIWRKFEKIRAYHDLISLNDNTEMAYRFYEGDQWYGIESGDETLPVYNFIKPTVNYKVSMIAMNSMVINYSVLGGKNEKTDRVTSALNRTAARIWERLKMDSKCWETVKASAIAGDSYVYFYDGQMNCQVINNTDIFFADEEQRDIQKQPYIIIAERRPVDKVIAEAERNGISKDEISNIIADEIVDNRITTENTEQEISVDGGKCTCLLYLELKENGDLEFSRCTKHVLYQPKETIHGYGCYPIAALVSNPKKGSSRGRGEVQPIINNQIEVNRNLARRLINAKLTAYSRLVYASDSIVNPKALTEAGTAIEIENSTIGDVGQYVKYLTPAPMSSEASNLTNELMNISRDLAGAGDAALGNVDPTQASGTAIIAVRDQAAIPLNEQSASFRQFVEDIAKIWLNIIRIYNPDGIKSDGEVITPEDIKSIELTVQIDVSSKTPFSKYAREQVLERLLMKNLISFEEYISSLDDDSSVPKSKLEKIASDRAAAIQKQTEQQKTQQLSSLPGTMAELQAAASAVTGKYSTENGGDI